MVTMSITFGLILLVVFMMSIGVILGRKPISGGSCCDSQSLKAECAGCKKHEKNGRPLGSPLCSGRNAADAAGRAKI
jgi:hypothetical protein